MLQKTITALFTGFQKPETAKPSDVNDAYRKVDRILDTAWRPEHIDVAERMFANMMKRYSFTEKDYESPLVIGMQDRINTRRAEVEAQWNAMHRVVAA